ncbi:diguanylate cyclase/phosphodiesterase (GGDEF & EAL domains) with PAS/PAC sensor(s) [Paramagnetospirillum magnetotacticum MS-1]|uniref:Diguanylate cyclase/phosphodiesterase (GGDEF & EAL domains) with PAS/PAC sensor(S) n=1 Tax=Paramagnetospirillum magnetotacticum MS-1 TaxID=272627 RepID=A0A0C2UGH7_PARME|nr:diguanylate cyclase [Paramagnetospirillum magnetotacticum]KIM00633.1 diguanylate cyclase/phosphodiesterase (GGDEF & EAL domains) with PAS/PAC sensor(s) [Paramagnetospirillum magnetotacticum MS-1]
MTELDPVGLAGVLEDSPVGVSISRRRDGIIVFANHTFCELIGFPRDKVLGSKARDYYVDDHQRATVIKHMKRHGSVDHAEVQFRRSDGTPFWTLLTIRESLFGIEPVNLAWVYDITERKTSEERLQLAAKVVETANEGIMITGPDGTIEAVNTAFTRITGFSLDEAIGKKPSILKSGRHDNDFYRDMWRAILDTGQWQGEVWNRRRTGEVFIEWLSVATVRDAFGEVSHMLGIFSDITARKEDEEQVWRQANFDALTGLPNRSLFLDRLGQSVKASKRDRTRFALMFIDLDGFKKINDTFGHACGDLLLQEAAARLLLSVRSSDTVARLSGDEFTVILHDVEGKDEIGNVAAKVVSRMAERFDLDGNDANVQASVGIAIFPDDADDAAMLIRLADRAMYTVKGAGKNNFGFHELPERLVYPLDA